MVGILEIKKEKVTEREGLVFQTYFEKIEKEKSAKTCMSVYRGTC